VKLLEAIDTSSKVPVAPSSSSSSTGGKASANMASSKNSEWATQLTTFASTDDEWEGYWEGPYDGEPVAEGKNTEAQPVDCSLCVDDLGRFFVEVGSSYARARLAVEQNGAHIIEHLKRRRNRLHHRNKDEDADYFDGSGAIS